MTQADLEWLERFARSMLCTPREQEVILRVTGFARVHLLGSRGSRTFRPRIASSKEAVNAGR